VLREGEKRRRRRREEEKKIYFFLHLQPIMEFKKK
jgi:hypothetical protein